MRTVVTVALFNTLVVAQYPPNFIDSNGGDTAAAGKGMQSMMGGLKPPVQIDNTGASSQFKAKWYEDPSLPKHTIHAPS